MTEVKISFGGGVLTVSPCFAKAFKKELKGKAKSEAMRRAGRRYDSEFAALKRAEATYKETGLPEDRDYYFDLYKDYYGFRPHF